MTTTATVQIRLRKPLEKSIRAGHPWIYRDALALPDKPLKSGSIVDIHAGGGQFVARGLYDAQSPIAVRVATLDRGQPLDAAFVDQRVAMALRARRGAIDASTTDAFRWLNGEGDLLPGVVVDVYGAVAIVRFDGEAVRVWRDWVTAAVVAHGRALGIGYVYERSRGGRGEVLPGGAPPSPVEIREHGVRFAVDVVHGQKTGFFLDQRENRRAIRPFAAGVDVVNLFGYTGGFSVNAALGGARRVTTVDVAAPALVDARANFALNGIDPERHGFDAEDAFDWLERARGERRRYGLVITDPPSFAPSEKALQKGLSAYRDLHARALSIVEEGGVFVAASCSSHVTMDAFVGTLKDAADKGRRALRMMELRGQPADHPTTPAFAEGRYLKCIVCRVD